jgi:hypothetical protein
MMEKLLPNVLYGKGSQPKYQQNMYRKRLAHSNILAGS